MLYEDEDPPYVEPDALAHAAIGAAIEVHRVLGPGLDEGLYAAAYCVELRRRDIPFACEVVVPVEYKGELIGNKRIDFIVGGRLIVEFKVVEALSALHKAQVNTYLKVTALKVGLLINFNTFLLKDGIRRVIRAG